MNLFTQKQCDYCGESPISPSNNLFFHGFRDTRTKHLVCWKCKNDHYKAVQKELNGKVICNEVPEYL